MCRPLSYKWHLLGSLPVGQQETMSSQGEQDDAVEHPELYEADIEALMHLQPHDKIKALDGLSKHNIMQTKREVEREVERSRERSRERGRERGREVERERERERERVREREGERERETCTHTHLVLA